ncbi:MAG: GH67, partial [uncultured Sphingomonadaceae bacterium]
MMRFLLALQLLCLAMLTATPASAEDGSDLWLRYRPVEAQWQARYQPLAASIVVPGEVPTLHAARDELERGLTGLLGVRPRSQSSTSESGSIIVGTPQTSPEIARLKLPLARLGAEGYLIRSVRLRGHPATVIAANTNRGALYGVFHLLRLIQTRQAIDRLDISSTPKIQLRLLNHWDNLDRTVERGYAGFSLWDWHKLPGWRDKRYIDYARANASIGINGTVLNNVNSNAQILTPLYLEKVAALADTFRPYGIKVYLSARFSA